MCMVCVIIIKNKLAGLVTGQRAEGMRQERGMDWEDLAKRLRRRRSKLMPVKREARGRVGCWFVEMREKW